MASISLARANAFAAIILIPLAFLGSCTSSTPHATAHVAEPAQVVDPCTKYKVPTDFGRCRLFTTVEGLRFIPEIGRNADLDTQIRCAPVRTDLEVYEWCIRRELGTSGSGSLAARAPEAPLASSLSNVEPTNVEPTNVEPTNVEPSVEESDRPRSRAWTLPTRIEPSSSVTVARTISKTPAAVSEQTVRSYPLCAENGSCYGDVSSYTGRPKTVHVGATIVRMAPTYAATSAAARGGNRPDARNCECSTR
jgi:hypothetical protein